MSEAAVVKRVMMEASHLIKSGLPTRLLRNNRGQFYTMDKKRIVRAGLEADGSSDCIGMVTITITPEMVGMSIGVPLVAEVKDAQWKRNLNDEHENTQENFINQVCRRGGIGFFINNHEDLEKKIKERLKIMVDSHLKRV